MRLYYSIQHIIFRAAGNRPTKFPGGLHQGAMDLAALTVKPQPVAEAGPFPSAKYMPDGTQFNPQVVHHCAIITRQTHQRLTVVVVDFPPSSGR